MTEETKNPVAAIQAEPDNGKRSLSLDDLMEAAGFVTQAPKETTESEAAQPYRAHEVHVDAFGRPEAADAQKSLAEILGYPYVDVSAIRPTPELLKAIPKKTITRYKTIFPVEITPTTLKVAFADPYDVNAHTDVELIADSLGLQLEMCLGEEEDIFRAIDTYYTAERNQISALIDEISDNTTASAGHQAVARAGANVMELSMSDEDDLGSLAKSLEGVDLESNEAPLVRLINLIFRKALKMRASDIHFESYSDEFRIRFRIDGVLQDIESPPTKLQASMISRLKIMSGMDLAEKKIPQDGRIQLRMEDKDIDFRVSCLPSIWGVSMVLRILDKTGLLLGLEEVGFMPDNIALFKKLIKRPNGIILMTGPTGCGKTTTLYAALNTINTPDTKIITVENPVEYMIDGINQVQVHDEIGLDFANVLRTMLRQAPNVILVGEMRDLETAETGIRAALTGHLVFSTLHTNDAPSATTRLIEMGIKPYLVSSALQAVIAQRLVRRICPECKEPYYPPPAHIEEFGVNPDEFRGQPFYQGVGCHTCNYSGYRGRTAIHEIMVLSDDLRGMILKTASAEKIRRKSREEGMRTLREDGWQKILRGETTIEEVMRVTADELK